MFTALCFAIWHRSRTRHARFASPLRKRFHVAEEYYDPKCPLWRNDSLVGKCFGLECGGAKREAAKTPKECASLCCSLEDACITWQFRDDIGCCTGAIVRLGDEDAGVGNWCEPTPPRHWLGRRVTNRAASDGKCTWTEKEEKAQCFGLGGEKTSGSKSVEACAAGCCQDPDCNIYQFREDKGCFWGQLGHTCDGGESRFFTPYIGHRKIWDRRRGVDDGWPGPRINGTF